MERDDTQTWVRRHARWWLVLTTALALALAACSEPQAAMPDPAITANDFVIAALSSSSGAEQTRALRESTVTGIVTVSLADRDYIAKVDYYLGGKGNLVQNATEAPFEVKIDTRKLPNGEQLLIARAWVRTGDTLVPYEFDVEFKVKNGAGGDRPAAAGGGGSAGSGAGGAASEAADEADEGHDDGTYDEADDGEGSAKAAAGGTGAAGAEAANAGDGAAGAKQGAAGEQAGAAPAGTAPAAAQGATADGAAAAAEGEPDTAQHAAAPAALPASTLRGDPAFDAGALPEAERAAHEALLADVRAARPALTAAAASGDLHALAREVAPALTRLLAAFRASGDLRLLDAVDPVMQAARGALADHNGDGFRDWRWLASPLDPRYGDDVDPVEDSLAHGVVAAVAWAYQHNRDLASPSGVNYGERADFWRSYLQQGFEAKWRARDGAASGPSLPPTPLLHAQVQQARYLWHMARLSGSAAYAAAAQEQGQRLAAALDGAQGLPWTLAPNASRQLPQEHAALALLTLAELADDGLAALAGLQLPSGAAAR